MKPFKHVSALALMTLSAVNAVAFAAEQDATKQPDYDVVVIPDKPLPATQKTFQSIEIKDGVVTSPGTLVKPGNVIEYDPSLMPVVVIVAKKLELHGCEK